MEHELNRLPPRPLAELLGDLSELSRRSRAGDPLEVPAITLWLTSGSSLEGHLVALQQGQLLMRRDGGLQATYLPIESVLGVTVHYSPKSLHLLSQGRLDPVDSPAPSRLELKRTFQALLDELGLTGEVSWDRLPNDPAGCRSLGLALAELREALLAIGADSEGKSALRQSLRSLSLQPDTGGPTVKRTGDLFTIVLGLENGELRRLSAAELRRQMEKLL